MTERRTPGRPDEEPTGPIARADPAPDAPGTGAPGTETLGTETLGTETLGTDAPGTDTAAAPTLLQQMGGASGIVASGVPVLVFVVVQSIASTLTVSVIAAVLSSVAIAVWRLVRGEALQPAFTGLFGVAVAAFIAYRSGEARDFFLLGIWTSLVYAGVFLVSVLVRRPLVGVLWHLVNGDGQGWRRSPVALRAYSLASLAWVAVFGARFVVQHWLYDSASAVAWLGWARIAMGLPLAALAAAATVWAVRRAGAARAGDAHPA